jgi:transcription elongation GreA/GreB family factor
MEPHPTHGNISDQAPNGMALLGKKDGDKADHKTPGGTHVYKIIEIN